MRTAIKESSRSGTVTSPGKVESGDEVKKRSQEKHHYNKEDEDEMTDQFETEDETEEGYNEGKHRSFEDINEGFDE